MEAPINHLESHNRMYLNIFFSRTSDWRVNIGFEKKDKLSGVCVSGVQIESCTFDKQGASGSEMERLSRTWQESLAVRSEMMGRVSNDEREHYF